MVTVSCFCKKTAPQGRRCSSQTWSCGKKCSKLLSCKEHKCEEVCHDGPCPPCPRKSTQSCRCGLKKQERPCHAIEFQCDKVLLHLKALLISFHPVSLLSGLRKAPFLRAPQMRNSLPFRRMSNVSSGSTSKTFHPLVFIPICENVSYF